MKVKDPIKKANKESMDHAKKKSRDIDRSYQRHGKAWVAHKLSSEEARSSSPFFIDDAFAEYRERTNSQRHLLLLIGLGTSCHMVYKKCPCRTQDLRAD